MRFPRVCGSCGKGLNFKVHPDGHGIVLNGRFATWQVLRDAWRPREWVAGRRGGWLLPPWFRFCACQESSDAAGLQEH